MKTDRPPAFQFYAKDWRDVKVRRMSLAAQGAYMSILADMWVDSKDQCSILDCNAFIARSLGISLNDWMELRGEIQHEHEPLLVEENGRFISSRLKSEVIKQRKFRKLQSDKGKRSAEVRSNRGSTVVQPYGQPKVNSSSSSSSSLSSPDLQPASQAEALDSSLTSKCNPDLKSKIRAVKTAKIDLPGKSVLTWDAYASAYERRYHVTPVRHAGINSMLGKLVDKLGAEESPLVAAFYLTHNAAFYVQKMHPVNLLLADAEKLRTEWATNTKITSSAVKNAEFKDNVVEQVKRIEALRKGGHA